MKDNLAKAQSAMLGNKSSLKTDSLTGEQQRWVCNHPCANLSFTCIIPYEIRAASADPIPPALPPSTPLRQGVPQADGE